MLATKTPRPSRLLAALSPFALTACLLDGGDGGYNKPVTTFDFTRLYNLPSPLIPWYHVPGGKAITGVKFAFRSLDYGRQADSNIRIFGGATGFMPAAAGAYIDLRVNAARFRTFLDSVHAHGVVPYVTFDPKEFANPDVNAQHAYLGQIPQGVWDAKLKEVAGVLRDFGYPVLFRFAHEMNGNWYPYGGAFTGGGSDKDGDGAADGPQAFVAAWRHVHALFAAEGATELVWVYSPNAESFPDAEWNQPYAYYPGSDYVDLIAVDVYEHPQRERRSLASLLEPVFNDFGLFFEKHAGDPKYRLRPFGLGEYGTARPDPQDRLNWYNDAFVTLSEDLRIAFHAVYNAQNGDQDFSLPGPVDSLMYGQGRFAFGALPWEPKNWGRDKRLARE